MIKRLLWLAFLILAAPATAQTLDEQVMKVENQVCGQSPCLAADLAPPPAVLDPDSPVVGVPQAIAAMPPGSWLAYGAPWDEAAPEVRPCGKRFGAILRAWNGWARDGLRYVYVAASGGHGDGCDNGVYRYDIQAGKAEMLVPHVELNAGLETTQPFVADVDGTQILPRSSHTGTGPYFEHPWLNLVTGPVYKSSADGQVWRFHVENLRWERLPDRRYSNGDVIGRAAPIVVNTPDGTVLMASGGSNICDTDLVAGRYDCQRGFPFSVYDGVAWDPLREGIWQVRPKQQVVRFLHRVDGIWQVDESLSGTIPDDFQESLGSHSGICVVPDGTILVWSKSADLHRWNGASWSIVSAPGGPPAFINRRVKNKWSWDAAAQVCIGGSSTKDGLWVYKPVGLAGSAPLPEPEPDPTPEPAPAPEPEPEPVDLEAKWSIDRDNLVSIGGIAIQVAPWQPAPWDQPIERLPGAPDYDAICPGEWTELHYRTNADLAGSKSETNALARSGIPNVRIYLYPLKNATGDVVAYSEGINGRSRCLEVIGMPDSGRKPQLMNGIGLKNGRGLIVRGVFIAESGGRCIAASGNREQLTQPAFVVIHNSEFYACGGHVFFFGTANREMPPTYLEMIGNVSAYASSHTQYNERSMGRFVYKSNICFAPGWGHCLKNLAHSSLIEGNVFANAGIDGQVVEGTNGRIHKGGMHPLDLYGCTQTVVRGNTFVYRTTSNIRNIMSFRARSSWGGCDKGRRLTEDRWELLRPTDLAYQDSAFWDEVRAARPLFDEGFEAARASDLLFTHKVEDNRFIVLLAFKPDFIGIDRVSAARVKSLRPTDRRAVADAIKAEAIVVSDACSGDAVCFFETAGPGLRYAYDHLPADWQRSMVNKGRLPTAVPIPAPDGWAERYAVYWGAQEGWACDAEGISCVPWDVPAPRVPVEEWDHDPVKQASPLRVIVGE